MTYDVFGGTLNPTQSTHKIYNIGLITTDAEYVANLVNVNTWL